MDEAERIQQSVLAEIVKKVQFQDRDIIVVRTAYAGLIDELADEISKLHEETGNPIRFLLVEESQIDLLREADEDMMRELGWQKIKK